MNTYDPMNCIVYRHMPPEADSCAVPETSGRACSRLPTQYANKSAPTTRRARTPPPEPRTTS